VARDRVQWRVLENMIINQWVSCRAEGFCSPISVNVEEFLGLWHKFDETCGCNFQIM
jgi:hypothetical protein